MAITAEDWQEISEAIEAAIEEAKSDLMAEIRQVEKGIETLRQELDNV